MLPGGVSPPKLDSCYEVFSSLKLKTAFWVLAAPLAINAALLQDFGIRAALGTDHAAS